MAVKAEPELAQQESGLLQAAAARPQASMPKSDYKKDASKRERDEEAEILIISASAKRAKTPPSRKSEVITVSP